METAEDLRNAAMSYRHRALTAARAVDQHLYLALAAEFDRDAVIAEHQALQPQAAY